MNTPPETDPEPYKSIFNKLPYEGDSIGEDVFRYVGKHGGFITDGNLKHHYMRSLSDQERHLLAEYMGFKRFVRQDGKLQWNWDLQSDQSIEARMRRLKNGFCPIHGLRFWASTRGRFDDDGVFREDPEVEGGEPWCPHCPHCREEATKPKKPFVYVAKCGFCAVLAYQQQVDDGKETHSLLPEFKYLLESSAPVRPAVRPRRAEVIQFGSARGTSLETRPANDDEETK